MFKLIRRISSSVYPCPDRPWGDDATSNAPTIGRKRRMDDDDEDMHEGTGTRKRRGQLQRDDTLTSELGEVSVKGKETDPAVKEVTQGVKEVELAEKAEETKEAPEVMDQVVGDVQDEISSSTEPAAETVKAAEEFAPTSAPALATTGTPSADVTDPIPLEPSKHDVAATQLDADPTAMPLPASDSEDDAPSPKPNTAAPVNVQSDATQTPDPEPPVAEGKGESTTKEEDDSAAP